MTDTMSDEELESDRERTFRHRLAQLAKLGFAEEQAFELAQANVDWHEAERMLRDGCSHSNVIRILL